MMENTKEKKEKPQKSGPRKRGHLFDNSVDKIRRIDLFDKLTLPGKSINVYRSAFLDRLTHDCSLACSTFERGHSGLVDSGNESSYFGLITTYRTSR